MIEMGGSSIANDNGFDDGVTTIVLVGCTGNGKSATGNSILGRNAFQSESSLGGVTTACERHRRMLQDDQFLNVIDTPGLFDSSVSPQNIENEIVRCVDMARDGIHSILIVVSLKVRFTEEQGAAVETLKHLFGARIVDYMIVAFTGGDKLKEGQTLDDHLARACPQSLKELLEKCGNRRVVFDNKTTEEAKKAEQLHQLLALVSETVEKNGGKPYTHELFLELKNADAKMDPRSKKEYEMQLRIAEMVHEKLRERNDEIINNLKVELEKARREANERAEESENARRNSEDRISKLGEQLENAQRTIDGKWNCAVM